MLSLNTYRDYLNFPPGKESELEALRDEVEALWVQETGRPWDQDNARVETYRTDGTRITTLFLELTPVTSITQVRERNEGATDWDDVLTTDDYSLVNDQLIRVGTWWKQIVEVTFAGGYAEDACPADVRRALLLQAKFSRDHLDKNIQVSAQNFKGGAGTYHAATLHPHFAHLAEAKRRLV